MKKLFLALGCIAAMISIDSCSADIESNPNTLNQKINQEFIITKVDTVQKNTTADDPTGDNPLTPPRPK